MPRAASDPGGIYAIVHVSSGKAYVGSAISLKLRRRHHLARLRSGSHHNRHLQRAWKKHGEKAFRFEMLEQVFRKEQLVEREQYWIDKKGATQQKSTYNLAPTAQSQLGFKWSRQQRKRARESHLGYEMPISQKRKISKALKETKEHGLETRHLLSVAHAVHTKLEVYSILNKYYLEGLSQTSISEEYPVSFVAINRLVRGLSHKNWVRAWLNANRLEEFPARVRGRSKLTTEDVVDILDRLREGEVREDIAREFRISKPQVTAIAKGRSHRSVRRASIKRAGVSKQELAALDERFSKLDQFDVTEITLLIKLRCQTKGNRRAIWR